MRAADSVEKSLGSASNDISVSSAGAGDEDEDLEVVSTSPAFAPLIAGPGRGGVPVFPQKEFLTLMEGLNRYPSWVVYPGNLARCLQATVAIQASRRPCATSLHFCLLCILGKRQGIRLMSRAWHALCWGGAEQTACVWQLLLGTPSPPGRLCMPG